MDMISSAGAKGRTELQMNSQDKSCNGNEDPRKVLLRSARDEEGESK